MSASATPAMSTEAGRLVDVGDTALYVVEARGSSDGGLPLVALHGGMGLDHSYLRSPLEPLAGSGRVLLVDQRANGRSGAGRPLAEISMATWADDIDVLCSTLDAGRVVLFGHSYGGFVAIECALRHPERVAGLVLCATAAAFDHRDAVLANLARRGATADQRRGFLPPSFATDEEFRDWLWSAAPLYLAPGSARVPDVHHVRYRVETLRRGGEVLKEWDRRRDLASLTMPTLVLGGRHDVVMPVEEAMAPLAAALPACTSVVFEDSGHFPFLEEPERFTRVVHNWMACLRHANDHRGAVHA